MTISSTTNRWAGVGNGSTTEFFFTGRIFADTDIKIHVDGVLKTIGSDYEVSGVGSPNGGKVTFETPPISGAQVVLIRDVPATQDLDMVSLGSFPAEENEKALDRLTVLAQQLENKAERALRQPDDDTVDIGPVPNKSIRAGRILAFDNAGNPVTTTVNLPSGLTSHAGSMPRVNAAQTAYELRTPEQVRDDLQLVVGTHTQAWDADLDGVATLSTTGLVRRAGEGSFTAGPLDLGATAEVTGNLPVARLNGGSGANASTFWRGDGTWASVNIASATQVTGNLPVSRLNNGADASSSTFWRGDGAWASVDISSATQITGNLPVNRLNGGSGATAGTFWRGDGSWSPVDISSSTQITGNLPISRLNSGEAASGATFWRGDGTWSAVDLTSATQLTGNLPVNRLNGGMGASALTFWRGDGVWSTLPGSGDVSGPTTTTEGHVPQWNAGTRVLQDGLAVGTAPNNLVQLDPHGRLPAVNASQLTHARRVNAGALYGQFVFHR